MTASVEVLPGTKNSLLCDSAALLLVFYPRGMKSVSLRDLWTPKLIVALSVLAQTWDSPKCLSTEEQTKHGKHTPYALAEPKEPSTSVTLGVNRTAHIISTDHPSSEHFKAVKHRI